MKRFFSFLLILVLFITVLPLQAEADGTVIATSSYGAEWNAIIDESTQTCTVIAPFTWNSGSQSSNGSSGAFLEIPSSLKYDNTDYRVTTIKGYFLKDQDIHSGFSPDTVIIPETVENIDRLFLSDIDNKVPIISETIYVLNHAAESALTISHVNQSSNVAIKQYSGQDLVSYKGWLKEKENGSSKNSLYWILDTASQTVYFKTTRSNSTMGFPSPSEWANQSSSLHYSSLLSVLGSNNATTLYIDEGIDLLKNLSALFSYITKVNTVDYAGTYQKWTAAFQNADPSSIFSGDVTYRYEKCIVRFFNEPESPIDRTVAMYEPFDEQPVSARQNYVFDGWFTDEACTENSLWDFDTDTPSMMDLSHNSNYSLALYAGWTAIHDISTASTEHGTFVIDGPVSAVREGSTVNLIASPDPGYELDEWIVTDSSNNSTSFTENYFTMPDSDVTVKAAFKLKTFYIEVQVETNCNGSAQPSEGTMGSSVQLSSSTVDSRREFDYWEIIQGDISIDPATNTFTIGTSDIVVKAHFKLKPVRKYEYNIIGDGTVTPDIVKPIEGDTISLTVEPVYGNMLNTLRVFNKETGEEISIYNNSFTMPGADVIISAVFNELQPHYIVWLDSDGNELERRPYFPEAGDKTPAATSNTKTPTKPMDETYIYSFQAWNSPVYQGNDTVYSPIFSQVERRTFLVIWMNEDGSELDSKPFLEGDPEPITDKIPTKISVMGDYAYIFKEWGNRTEDKAKGTITYFAVFSDETTPLYGILVLNDGSGTASADMKSAVEGATVTLTATPLPGYKFKAWEVVTGDVVVTNDQFVMGTENVRIRATFEKLKTVYVSFDADGGTGSMSQVSMYAGSEYSLPNCSYAAPQGKEFSCWDISGNTYQPEETISVNDDITAKAVWKDKSSSSVSYTVTFMIDNEYSVAVQTVFKGNKANKPSDPLKDGYIFVGWYTDSSLTTPFSFDTPIETNWTLYAKWTPKAAETDETIEYTIVSGAAQKWTKGSTNSIEISAKRNLEDNTTLSHFVSLQIDGKSLVKDLEYTVRSGSVIATINPSALQNLGTGIHRITFVFDDGKAETTLTVEQSSDSSGSGSSGGGSSSGGSSSVPSTGDIFSNPFLWFGGMAIVIFFLKLFIDSRKKRLAEAEAMQNEKY